MKKAGFSVFWAAWAFFAAAIPSRGEDFLEIWLRVARTHILTEQQSIWIRHALSEHDRAVVLFREYGSLSDESLIQKLALVRECARNSVWKALDVDQQDAWMHFENAEDVPLCRPRGRPGNP
jgi:hypothetical protein